MKLFRSFLFAALILSNGACNFNPGSLDSLTWKVDLLGPLVKTEMTLEEITQFDDISLPLKFKLSSIVPNFQDGVPLPSVPSIKLFELPPQTFSASDAFESISFDSGEMFYVIDNQSPLTIKAGGIIVIKDSADGSIILYDSLKSDILPFTSYTMDPVLNLQGNSDLFLFTVGSTFEITISNFITDSIPDPTTFTSAHYIGIEFNLNAIKINSIVANPDTFIISDTTDFNLEGDILSTNVEEGMLINFINNELPVEINLQGYFYDESKTTILDSLFSSTQTIPAADSVRIEIDIIKIFENIKNAKFLHTYAQFIIPGPGTQIFKKQHKVKLQVVGDIKVKLN